MKSIIPIFLAVMITAACNQSEKQSSEKQTETKEITTVSVDEILNNPSAYQDKEVRVTGMVTHVCRHGGQKCFITAGDPDKQLRISVSKQIPEFEIDLEGSTVEFTGKLLLMEDEAAIAMQQENDEKDHHTGDEAHAKAENASFHLEAIAISEVEPEAI